MCNPFKLCVASQTSKNLGFLFLQMSWRTPDLHCRLPAVAALIKIDSFGSRIHPSQCWKFRNMRIWAAVGQSGVFYYFSKKITFQAVINSATSASARKTKSRARERPAPAVRMPSPHPGAPLDPAPLDLLFLKAALVADLIMA